MIKPKRKRPTDVKQLAASVLQDAIRATDKPFKAAREAGRKAHN